MDFTDMFEKTFEDATKYTCISVKLNWEQDTVPEQLDCAFDYVMDTTKILACSAGKHYEGEHGVPHIHLHFIVERYNKPSNPSQHRNRWLSKDTDRNLDGCSFMY